jgi:hypothetical protein
MILPCTSPHAYWTEVTYAIIANSSGIVGLYTARQLALKEKLSVALVEAKQLCAGATGAGIDYTEREKITKQQATMDKALHNVIRLHR